MSDRPATWIRSVLVRTGRMLLESLTVMGSMWCGASGIATSMRREALRDDSDVGVREEARQGIEEIEAYLDSLGPSTGPIDKDRRRRRRGEAS
ncbi:MAG TPA: hypothetical protein VEX15_19545 [Nocardioidaceae bacterium]|nr:hypothetical protein [Nocardioidaceae bacterium]